MKHQPVPRSSLQTHALLAAETARAYDGSQHAYLAYADGDPSKPFDFQGHLAFADAQLWRRIEAKLTSLAQAGQRTLRFLDAGSGPGTWTHRIVLAADQLGFTRIEAHCLDLSPAMVATAHTTLRADHRLADITVACADLTHGLPFEDRRFDLTLCLYGVLNHLTPELQARVAADLARVTQDTLFVTVRSAGSLPTAYICGADSVRAYRQNNDTHWIDLDLVDGRHLGMPSYLFTAADLRALFQPHLSTVCMTGLDLFHSRFAPNPAWNPPSVAAQPNFAEALARLEHLCGASPALIDHAAHILLVGER
jgi:SAM-dependent methyltransferase